MPSPRTEMTPAPGGRIDAMPAADALAALLAGQVSAVQAVAQALPRIEAGAAAIAAAIDAGGALNYVAAGSSGLMALADGAELPGTFGIPQRQVRIFMAGGVPADGRMPGETEDDVSQAARIAAAFGPRDLVIALSASGSTPYPCEIARRARARGVAVVAIANNAGSPLLELADVPILLPTPPELVAGSTRLGAGTAQKAALNLMSTLAGVMLGHVHDGMMVNLHADNAKLRGRAAGIVAAVSGAAPATAEAALRAAGGDAKLAILLASGLDGATAARLLDAHGGRLGPCLREVPPP